MVFTVSLNSYTNKCWSMRKSYVFYKCPTITGIICKLKGNAFIPFNEEFVILGPTQIYIERANI